MGALTRKIDAYKYRPWEVSRMYSIKLNTPARTTIRKQKFSSKTLRILARNFYVKMRDYLYNFFKKNYTKRDFSAERNFIVKQFQTMQRRNKVLKYLFEKTNLLNKPNAIVFDFNNQRYKTTNYNEFSKCDLVFFNDVNPDSVDALLLTSLLNILNKKELVILTYGKFTCHKIKTIHLGNSKETYDALIDGKHALSMTYHNAKKKLIISKKR